MWADGEGLGQMFYLLGVRPRWLPNGRVAGIEVIPLEELGCGGGFALRRYWMVLWAAVLAAVLLAAAVWPAVAAQQKRITVTEYFVTSKGEIEKSAVRVPCPPRRVVVLGGYPAEMLKALGVEKTVVAVDDHTKDNEQWPNYVTKLPSVGKSSTPSVEKILALKPDLVIEGFLDPKLRSQLNRAGIPVLRIYGYRTELIPQEIRTLGLVFDCRKRASDYAGYIEKRWQVVQARTKGLSSRQKPKVYWESGLGEWKTNGRGSGAHPLIEWAGGINIAADRGIAYPVVTSEWVAAKNPDVIIKYVSAPECGWEGDVKKLEEIRQQIMRRPALRNTSAVKEGRVFLVSSKITCAPRGAAGEYYIAKWLHPELFKDIDPEAVHREMLKKFYGEELKGVWVYPSK
ncbi:iron complex transport system substrate-binding protein [Desulfofundulus thermosubterraneus DSM 16057]|uniref:Iron complex transport system substrate-binding protein n=2 Tax=Desulfofundulus TaxID=2282741 RepID=A0A1M6EFZ2_9FIRM|nr:iron complex transport system substrate-binding protein [Desulfofundulus thermosubterraneus DSM 16057]